MAYFPRIHQHLRASGNRERTRPSPRSRAIRLVLVILQLPLFAAFLLEARRRQGFYWYDAGADYSYRFVGDRMQRIPARLGPGGLVLAPSARPAETAFVALSVEGTFGGAWFEPSIEVLVDGRPICRQFLERWASGRRYVNLCLRAEDLRQGIAVQLRGRHVRVPEQEVEVLLFSARDPDAARILVLAPHPDDAEIAAFGLYASRDSWVVTVTTGSYPGRKYERLSGDAHDREELQARLRVWDSLNVPSWGGVPPEHAVNLGYFTGTIEPMYLHPARVLANPVSGSTDVAQWRRFNRSSVLLERPGVSSWESLVEDLIAVVERARPNIIVAPHPALDASRDHMFTTAALLDALAKLNDPDLDLFLYTNHHTLSEYFPFGPADGVVTLPPWFDSAVTFRSIYSHPLHSGRVRDKLFALEHMHDLRSEPERILTGPTSALFRRAGRSLAGLWHDPAQDYSYFRRAVRPNELFFVYDSSDREMLQRHLPPRQPPVAFVDSTAIRADR